MERFDDRTKANLCLFGAMRGTIEIIEIGSNETQRGIERHVDMTFDSKEREATFFSPARNSKASKEMLKIKCAEISVYCDQDLNDIVEVQGFLRKENDSYRLCLVKFSLEKSNDFL